MTGVQTCALPIFKKSDKLIYDAMNNEDDHSSTIVYYNTCYDTLRNGISVLVFNSLTFDKDILKGIEISYTPERNVDKAILLHYAFSKLNKKLAIEIQDEYENNTDNCIESLKLRKRGDNKFVFNYFKKLTNLLSPLFRNLRDSIQLSVLFSYSS